MLTKGLSKREKVLFGITVTLIAAVGLYMFVAEPVYSRWKTLNDEIESKADYITNNKRLLERYRMLEEQYIKFPGFTSVAESEEKEVAKALSTIEVISNLSSCRIQNVKPRASRKIAGYRPIYFKAN